MKDVFVSYSRKNAKFVDRLVSDLKEHGLDPWIDTLEVVVGDRPRVKIEEGIESSRYFCLVVSQASMRSFYVRQLEIEAAFRHMIRTGRQDFILPILWRFPQENLPLMLGSYHYLDFTRATRYTSNMHRLVNKIRLQDERFSGIRLYKNVDTSMTGQMFGVQELKQIPRHGSAVKAYFEDGRIVSIETYTDGQPDGAKRIHYDDGGRVFEITLFRANRVVDTWRYHYSDATGLRVFKLVVPPGQPANLRMTYDRQGNKLTEEHLASDGSLDNSRGYAVTEFERNAAGQIIGRTLKDASGRTIRHEEV